jgi:DNA-binding transcriptional regulator GbsR (MarR family)
MAKRLSFLPMSTASSNPTDGVTAPAAGDPGIGAGPTARPTAWGEAQERFIATWGQMAARWGIRRTMAEVHALLYITGTAMNTDDVMNGLGISRGNASTALRELGEWGVITREHVPGDRKEYFVAEQDVWKLFHIVMRERKKREIDPLLEALSTCSDMTQEAAVRATGGDQATIAAHHERIDQLLEFVTMLDTIGQRFISPRGRGLQMAAKLLSRAS